MPGVEQHPDVAGPDRRHELHEAVQGVNEFMPEGGTVGLGTEELDPEPAPLVAQDLRDGSQPGNVPVEVLAEWTLVGARWHVSRGPRRAERSRRRRQSRQLAQIGFPLIVVAPGDGEVPERGFHSGSSELILHRRQTALVDG